MRAAATCGLAGPAMLIAYFAAPAFAGWPFAGAPSAQISRFALDHETLFYAGAWLQGTGTVLCVLFFIALLASAGSLGRPAAVVALIGASSLLAAVLIEGALLVAVPAAARAGDLASVATTFALSNGAFLRVFPIAPASVTYLGLGAAMFASSWFDRRLAGAALVLGAAFEVSGLAAIVLPAATAVIAVLSAQQALWIVLAAVHAWRSA
jgi:hypothetical protein